VKQKKTNFGAILSSPKNRVSLFYILAFIPLLVVFYYNPFSAVIPFYGFLILLIKQQKMASLKEANIIQKALGLIVAVGSFFIYYAVVLIYPSTALYGVANYVIYLLGLFLIFFRFPALKEAFAPLFLIVAATSSSLISAWLKPFLSPFANDFAHIAVWVLRALGINAQIYNLDDIPILSFTALSGKVVSGAFVYECIGVYSALVFSIILVVILFEDPSSLKVRLAFSIAGLVGTFALNIMRVTMIFLVDYFYGAEVGGTIHYIIGYALFSTWLACFFLIYSKRQALHASILSFWKKIH